MNKRFLFGMFFAFMAMAPWRGNAATQDIDSPHSRLQDGCANCHFANYEPGDCLVRCHNVKNQTPPYANTISPEAVTHKGLKCEACHNPHVSLQDGSGEAAYVEGTFGGKEVYNPTTGRTTLTNVAVVTGPPMDWRWAMKYGEIGTVGVDGKPTGVGKERGMLLWVDNGVDDQGNPQRASFEIKDIDVANAKVTVQGDATAIIPGGFELRWGQLVAKNVTTDPAKSYVTADPTKPENTLTDHAVSFPPPGSTSRYVDTTPGTSAKGICQACHIGNKSNGRGPFTHWNGSGANKTHNADKDCETCHPHSSGFMASACRYCHNGVSEWGAPAMNGSASTGLVTAPTASITGSTLAGAHEVHVGGRGGKSTELYNCDVCHVGSGMNTSTPDVINHSDGLQIGFNTPGTTMGYLTQYSGQSSVGMWNATAKKGYVPTNYTKVTANGTPNNYTCSNVYCHSDGASLRKGCLTAKPNTSPSWDTPTMVETTPGSGTYTRIADADGTHCNDCHGFSNEYGGQMATFRHSNHVNQGNKCVMCHADTIDENGNIINRAKHINGVMDVVGGRVTGGTNNTNMHYEPTTYTCSSVACHNDRQWITPTEAAALPGTCPNPCVELDGSNGEAKINRDPIMAWQIDNVDDHSLKITDVSLDPDRYDPVKSFCQGGGFNNTGGLMSFNSPDSAVNLGSYQTGANLQGTANPSTAVVRAYPANKIINGVAYFTYRLYDNGPLSAAKFATGVDNADDGWAKMSGWMPYTLKAVDMTHVNSLPIHKYTVVPTRNGDNSITLTLTDTSLDPDYNDSAKSAIMGGGHLGGPGTGRLVYTGGSPATAWTPITMQDVNSPPTTITLTIPASKGLKAGDAIWYQYNLRDNHWGTSAQTNYPSYTMYSGWRSVTCP